MYNVKSWFLSKNFTPNERIAISGEIASLVRETEKAVQLRWNTENGAIVRWVPKSCLETSETLAAENTPEKCAERLEALRAREENYEALIAQCKAHGIPARKGWRVATMQQRLAEVC